MALADVGAMFMKMAGEINPSMSQADQFMHAEIARLAKYIHDAKSEIFAISTNDKSETVITDASQHLDEVIKSTEQATNTIMDAADAIQNAAPGIGGDKEKTIMDASIRIYDACTFQDITGQRIRKVITLLENIEARIGKLNGLFGTNGEPAPVANGNKPLTDKDLLNGPQLAANASSQAEIDALFNSLSGKS
jgi:chemotaxis protein CheZ